LQRHLTKAFLSGAQVSEQVFIDDLTEKEAYKLEYDKLRDYVFAGKRDQLWNVIPASIQTPQEIQAYTERLQRNLNSRDRWVRTFSWMTLKALRPGQSQHELRLESRDRNFGCQRKLMESWATFVTTAPVEQRKGDVVPMRGR
jgi:hypothetical protein